MQKIPESLALQDLRVFSCFSSASHGDLSSLRLIDVALACRVVVPDQRLTGEHELHVAVAVAVQIVQRERFKQIVYALDLFRKDCFCKKSLRFFIR